MSNTNGVTFSDVNCPVCDGHDAKVLREASYPDGITVQQVQAMFSASSDHGLLDRVVECKCGMIYIAPRLDAELIESGYSSGEDPAFVAQNENRIRTFAGKIRSVLNRTGLNAKGRKMLDVGCAGARFSSPPAMPVLTCRVSNRAIGWATTVAGPTISTYARES